MLRLAAMVAVLAPALALGQEGVLWTATSANAEVMGQQTVRGKRCRFEVIKKDKRLWSVNRCIAERTDYAFVSDDGQSALVFFSLPWRDKGPPRARAGELYKRGARVKTFEVGQFVKNQKPLIMAQKHFYWLEGALGEAGVPPGPTQDGLGVELTTLDGKRWFVGFDGKTQALAPGAQSRMKK